MPIYDLRCNTCGVTKVDVYETIEAPKRACDERIPFQHYQDEDGALVMGTMPCGGTMERVHLPGKTSGVIGDECDVWIKHGICNEDGTPRHYRFKSEMRAEAKRRGLVNHVEHLGTRGGDKSKHTSRWV